MEANQHTHRPPIISPTKPLHLRKKSNPQSETKHHSREWQHHNSNAPKFPPRTSSASKSSMPDPSDSHSVHQRNYQAAASAVQSPRTALSDCINTYFSDSPTGDAPSIATSHSTVSEIKATYFSDSSSAIFGDFVRINSAKVGNHSAAMSGLGLSES
jgi:hypothetical protein